MGGKWNNDLGIKCGGEWSGGSVGDDDDGGNECFGGYKEGGD